ncbi:MAG: HAMP domain-containing protein [Deltaproteobacteria bacterium]|nr:HAMP domain-containing protein [Deltaproteobacteria bacterium]
MKIRTRLILVLSTLAVLVVLVSFTAVTAFARLGGTVAQAMHENLRSIDACAAMSDALDRTDRGFLLALSGQLEYGRDAVLRGKASFDEALAQAADNVTLPDEPAKIENLRAAWQQYRESTRRFESSLFPAAGIPAPPAVPATEPASVAAPASGPAPLPPANGTTVAGGSGPPPAGPAAVAAAPAGAAASSAATVADYVVLAEPHLVELREAVEELSELNHGGIESHATAASKSGWRRSAWVVSVGALGLALAIFLGRRLYRSITVPLEAIGRGIAALGRGDLSRRVAYHGSDELGQIALAVNAMAERLSAEEGQREGRLRTYERMTGAVLDAAEPNGIVFDREGRIVVTGRKARQRLGDDPLEALRRGAGGLLPAGEIDRLLEEVLGLRPSQLPEAPGAEKHGRVVVRPVVGRAGTVLGALVRVEPAGPAGHAGQPGLR